MSADKSMTPNARRKALKHVDEAPCGDGVHDLTNEEEVTHCSRCKKTWIELDNELNGER